MAALLLLSTQTLERVQHLAGQEVELVLLGLERLEYFEQQQ